LIADLRMLIADFLRPPKLSDRRNFVKAMRRWMIVDFDSKTMRAVLNNRERSERGGSTSSGLKIEKPSL
jgi:hypothetical protein